MAAMDTQIPTEVCHHMYDHLDFEGSLDKFEEPMLRLRLHSGTPQAVSAFFESLNMTYRSFREHQVDVLIYTPEGLIFIYHGLQPLLHTYQYDDPRFNNVDVLLQFYGFASESRIDSLDTPNIHFCTWCDEPFVFCKPHVFDGYPEGYQLDRTFPFFKYLKKWVCYQHKFNIGCLNEETDYFVYTLTDPIGIVSNVQLRFFTITNAMWQPIFNIPTPATTDYTFLHKEEEACIIGLKEKLVSLLETVNNDQLVRYEAHRT